MNKLREDVGMMRWSYKTVHFGLKKDGLLGSAFLDESAMEQSLNEYGQSGWELISLLETRDGLVAVFKRESSGAAGEVCDQSSPCRRPAAVVEEDEEPALIITERKVVAAPAKAPHGRSIVAVAEEDDEAGPSAAGIGSIRIE